MMKLQPHALLFDLDGVLVDSLDSWWQALNAALKTFNRPEIAREEFIEHYWGHDLEDNINRMKLDYEIGQFCNTAYEEHLDSITIYPDTKDILQQLTAYKKGVITNTPKDCASQVLQQFDIAQFFDTVITSDEVAKAKPSPEIVFKACHVLDVEPQDVIVIGDTKSDVKAGKAAGCTVIGVNVDADITIKDLSELTKLIIM